MVSAENILISVHPRHVDSMVAGRKTVELRRRPLNIQAGSRIWIYSTLPRGSVEVMGVVERVVAASPSEIWKNYRDVCGVTKKEFDYYYSGAGMAYVIVFENIKELERAFSLSEIRGHVNRFHPPQFFKRLSAGGPELRLFNTSLRSPLAA